MSAGSVGLQEQVPLDQHWQIWVRARVSHLDGHGQAVLANIRQAGFTHIESILSSKVYLLAGRLDERAVHLIAAELLTDPVVEVVEYERGFSGRKTTQPSVEVYPLPGVMNPVASSTLAAARRLLAARSMGNARLDVVQTARRYEIVGARTDEQLEHIASNVLANACVEAWYIQGFQRHDRIPEVLPTPPQRPFVLKTVPMRDRSDEALARLSRQGHLFLSVEEMRTIRDHFAALGRDPTDLELETLAQTWSEHCVHKTLNSEIIYRGDDFGRSGRVEVHFANLFKDTIVQATKTLDRPWCLSVFEDNAGIIAFDDDFGLAFKAETHNHPSAIEPYGGAATGIGGCIRDILGCGLGAKPIASTDVFCLAPPDWDPARLPGGVLHPRRILQGVVAGVRDYGNRMGIPTVNGAIHFDDRYLANPLVFCGCLGLIPRDRIKKNPHAGDRIVVAGGRTGRDGIHGATFSSAEMTDTHAGEFSHAVQIGNAIEEKKLLDALLVARDHDDGCLYSAVTDCGAGGLSSAVGEMGAKLGVVVELDQVPLKYSGLRYDEIWISEAQERMVFAVPPESLDRFLAVFLVEEVEATVIGTFTDDHLLRVRYRGHPVGELPMGFLHGGFPKTTRTATWAVAKNGTLTKNGGGGEEYDTSVSSDRLLAALGELNTASKEWVIRQYDHEVQGRSVVKPLMGRGVGPSDAAVLRPRYHSHRGAAVGCGLGPDGGRGDPYWMAVLAVDEALRNVVCVGADPDRTAILDNFCWPKVDTEETLGGLVRACRGAADAAVAYGLPFISGKDSLNNEFVMSKQEAERTGLASRIAIVPTLLISALALVEDIRCCVTSDLKEPGHVLAVASAPVDRVGLEKAKQLHDRVASLIGTGRVYAAHDVSDGGLAVAVAEMCIAGELGATCRIAQDTYEDSIFEPIATTYVLEMTEADAADAGLTILGRVEPTARLRFDVGPAGSIDLPVRELAKRWRAPLAEGGGS